MSRGRILVIRGGAIGDFILTLPVLSALQTHLPEARLEVLGYPKVAELARAGGLAVEVRSIEARALAGFFARNGELDAALQKYFSDFAVIISFLFDPDRIFEENVGRCSKAQFIPGPHRPDDAAGVHATKALLTPLERLAIFDADPVPRLKIPEQGLGSDTAATLEWIRSGPTLAVHPGSGSELKNWPMVKWQRALQLLAGETNVRFLVVGGEAEGDLSEYARGIDPERVRFARSLSLVDLTVLLQSCTGFVGHDSGITHLAAAVGLKGLVLWGPTAEAVWRPRSEKVSLLRSVRGVRGISVDRVVQETQKLLAREHP